MVRTKTKRSRMKHEEYQLHKAGLVREVHIFATKGEALAAKQEGDELARVIRYGDARATLVATTPAKR